jgi:hypothetical protein
MPKPMQSKQKTGPRRLLSPWPLFMLVFWGPWLFAWYWNLYPDTWSFSTVNRGNLIKPVIAVDDDRFTGHWTLAYLNQTNTSTCDTNCAEALEANKIVIQALGKDSSRVIQEVIANSSKFNTLPEDTRWILIDPKGKAMMSYPNELSQQALLKDLKRLLYVSQVG